MAKYKFTVNLTAVFEMEGNYAQAQTWLLDQLMEDEENTHMNIQRLDLVRWSDPATNLPIDANTGKPMSREEAKK